MKNLADNQPELASIINKSLRTTKAKMLEMQQKGLITRINGKRDGQWIINNQN